MSADHDIEARRLRGKVERAQVVNDIQFDGTDLDDFRLREFLCPHSPVDVSADGEDRSDFSQRTQNVRFSDISCVDDQICAFEDLDRFGSQKAVRV